MSKTFIPVFYRKNKFHSCVALIEYKLRQWQNLISLSLVPKIGSSFLLIFLFTFSSRLNAQEQKMVEGDTVACLKIIGLAVENNKPIDGIQVTLYKENEASEWDEITSVQDHEHSFSFYLQGNSYYTIEVSKDGYVKRLVGISTILPNDVLIKGKKYYFDFEVTMFKEKEGVDDYYLDFPVALIAYDGTSERFENNAKYTKHIKAKIKETLDPNDSTPVFLPKK